MTRREEHRLEQRAELRWLMRHRQKINQRIEELEMILGANGFATALSSYGPSLKSWRFAFRSLLRRSQ